MLSQQVFLKQRDSECLEILHHLSATPTVLVITHIMKLYQQQWYQVTQSYWLPTHRPFSLFSDCVCPFPLRWVNWCIKVNSFCGQGTGLVGRECSHWVDEMWREIFPGSLWKGIFTLKEVQWSLLFCSPVSSILDACKCSNYPAITGEWLEDSVMLTEQKERTTESWELHWQPQLTYQKNLLSLGF